jgi:acyl dehydratase
MYAVSRHGDAEMIDRAQSPKIECYDIPEDKPAARLNPFKTGEQVRLRDGTATSGIVRRILGNEVLVAWDGIPGDPQWYHQDYVAAQNKPVERGRVRAPTAAAENEVEARPNPFKIGEAVRLRDGTAANGIVTAIFGSEVRIAWEGVPGDPQWYHQDFVLAEKRAAQRAPALQENQAETDIVDQACRLVARMDDCQRQSFIARIRATYE